MIKIMQLSDIHFKYSNKSEVEKFILPALKKDIEKFKPIDLIVITGDLIDKGGIGFPKNKNPFEIFEEEFISKLNFDKNKILFVPGNHDIQRNAEEDYVEMGIEKKLSTVEEINEFIKKKEVTNDFQGIERIKKFKEFEKNFHRDNPNKKNISNFQSNFIYNINSKKVAITGFNSAWRCYDSEKDKGKILVGEWQITESRKHLEDCELKIGLIHHSLDYFSSIENRYINNFIEKDYNLLLCGHTHKGSNISCNSGNGGIIQTVAPANWDCNIRNDSTEFSNGYLLIEYDDSNNESINIHHRKYSYTKEEFIKNTEKGNSDGIDVFNILNFEEKAKVMDEERLATEISELHSDVRDSHLLSYNTDSKAPKDLDSIFVTPRIISKKTVNNNNNIKEITEKAHSIEEIIKSNENYIILGAKESGKTVLLDKILLEYSKNIKKLHKICVYIDLNEVNQRIENSISKFLKISQKNLPDFLLKYKVVLLVDNVLFEEKNNRNVKKLDDFIGRHKNIRIIVTSNETFEGSMTINMYDRYSNFNTFQVLNIEGFRTKEIKDLMKKWFHSNEYFNDNEKIENLISFFKNLNIPTTPLSISMFLWLIEKQENYKPINKASMVKDFLDKIFDYEREGIKMFYSEEFDRENSERLLAKIAYYMFKSENENYRIEYNSLLTKIVEHLKNRKFDFEADSILKNFLTKGILIREDVQGQMYIRYRFNCFFEYFLTKQMIYNENFKNFILDEKNYLRFANEIDYFTGIQRNNEKLLNTFLSRMEKVFEPLNSRIEKLDKNMDSIFESFSNPIANKINAKELTSQLKVEKEPSGEELEKVSDGVLDSINCENDIENKNDELSDLSKLEKAWVIPAIVLRNSDEIESKDTKYSSYIKILKSSLGFCNFYKLLLENHLKKKDEKGEIIEEYLQQIREVLPLIHQLVMHTIIGSNKLSVVIKEKMDLDFVGVDSKYNRGGALKKIKKTKELSDLEKYMSVFIYCDIKKDQESLKYVRYLIKSVKNKYIYDMILFKLILYYNFRAKSKEEENKYENLIADTIINAKHERKNKKSEYILEYRNSKKNQEEK